ncbi:MAG: helix-turn-helix transcriptional regulator [Negativibacillus massiliensis]|uniref:helix-turn-helix transcriptional regulator n=1 Tax=Negativibacillus massiliensis TaxID=1871035 RepID=UPI0023F642D6|nr:YafY family protein [Negativibacillus massiliensis]
MQESRLFRIVYYLLENGKATAPELAQKFEVSIRTIYRDIDAISSVGIPIYAAQGKGGGISILSDYTLEKSFFSEQEREQILMALQGIMATTGKTSDELLTKLSGLFQMKYTKWIEVDFSDWVQGKPQQNTFDLIKNAIFQKKVISFCYFNSKGNNSKRNARPICLVFKSKDWYLYAFCLLRNDYRFFKLTRIRQVEMLSDTFTQDFTPIRIEKQIHIEKTITVKLKFDRRIAFRVYDEFTDNITEDTQGNLYVQVNLPDNEILYSYLLSFAEYVEVLEPQCIRKQIKKRLQKMQEKYIT